MTVKTKSELFRTGVAASVMLVLSTVIADAHVKVFPTTSTVSAWEEYTVRVPTEKTIPTVKVVLKIPNGVQVEQYEPIAGWTFSEQKNKLGAVTSVTWLAKNGGILPGQYEKFYFMAQNPKKPGIIAWNAYQFYKDGSIVEWTGAASSATPHATTKIVGA